MNIFSEDDRVGSDIREQGKWIRVFLLLLLCAWLGGCARQSITLRILDQETKKPIKGAVAIAWYYNTYGVPGLTYHKTGDVAESESDADGYVTFPMFWTSVTPHVKVYKNGYVGWDNFRIYRGILFNDITRVNVGRRVGFKYKSQDIFLEPWKCEYSHVSHEKFLITHFPDDHKSIGSNTSIFLKSFNYYEIKYMKEELDYISLKRKGFDVKNPVCEKQK